MKKKYYEGLEELKVVVESTRIKGIWSTDGEGKHTFRSVKGGILDWWVSTNTLNFAGPAVPKNELEAAWDIAMSGVAPAQTQATPVGTSVENSIFVVHGHDIDARDQLELALHRLGLQPFILMNSSGGGKTIIEALEGHIGSEYTSAFGIVLMTPDDIGYAQKDGSEKAEPRARQNVILETGMLLSSLTRERMTLVVKGHLELPSDLEGIIRLGYNERIREVVPKLGQRLKEAGFDIDTAALSSAAM